MSRLLCNETPMLVLPKLATRIGLNETIFLQQLFYWLNESKHTHDGHHWVYNTYEGWKVQFPFWSISTIRRIISKLEQEKLILSGNFNRLKLDKTKWYRINYEALEAINGEGFRSSVVQNEEEVSVRNVQDESYEDSNCPAEETMLSTPLPEITSEKEEVKEMRTDGENPFRFFEQNGFGTIGAYISEKILRWCEDLSEELVIEAMKQAVENGSRNWKYIEAILRDWAGKGYQTVNEVHAAQLAFTERLPKKRKQSCESTGRSIPSLFKLDLCAGEDEEG
ncbi:DnaD and phage-associated domain-containing protein [Mesobacillus persicus]|uniref:DnaD and phage-associated domain-containing protein n=1 Tax=Mesobacillus persicus TaxID=930146 RepID=A0A1H8D7G4_9BACI|nr:DnaD domain protein [Mesobacillus persicus]SEN02417.1 DnaD and phage-associated domain-containing protein [Mesobacillus persicus]